MIRHRIYKCTLHSECWWLTSTHHVVILGSQAECIAYLDTVYRKRR